MKRTSILSGLALSTVLFASAASAGTLSLSMGTGGMINTQSGVANGVAPLATEISVGFNIARNVTLDAGFLFAHDVDAAAGKNNAAYVGFRPGIRAYGGLPWSNLRPYFRAALPVNYNSDTKSADIGLLVGGGLEWRAGRTLGVFGEAIVSPYFTNGQIPVEGRVGVSLHF